MHVDGAPVVNTTFLHGLQVKAPPGGSRSRSVVTIKHYIVNGNLSGNRFQNIAVWKFLRQWALNGTRPARRARLAGHADEWQHMQPFAREEAVFFRTGEAERKSQ